MMQPRPEEPLRSKPGWLVSLSTAVCALILTCMPVMSFADDTVLQQPKTVLRFVSWKPDQPKVWNEAVERFTAAHPHISIVREIAPHSSTAYHDLLSQKLKNHDPTVDLFFMDVIWVPEFAAAGWALPLDEYFSPPEQAKFLPATITAGTYQGSVYGIPSRIDGGMLYYRRDLLEAYEFSPPDTWDELARQAETIVGRGRHQSSAPRVLRSVQAI